MSALIQQEPPIVEITAEQAYEIEVSVDPWVILHNGELVRIFDDEETARRVKKERKIAGKLLKAEHVEWIVDGEVANPTVAPQPQEEFHTVTEIEQAEHCGETQPVVKSRGRNEKQIAAQMESKKLSRKITCITTGEEFKTAFAMYTAKPGWLTMTQRNKLTKELFAAAKEGRRAVIEINGREFQLSEV